MKLNYKRTILVGFAFFLISAFWQAYDSIVPMMLVNKFGMSQANSGIIMALDNILAVILLPLFGALSDKTNSRLGKRTPYIILGTILAIGAFMGMTFTDNRQLYNLYQGKSDEQFIATVWEENLEIPIIEDISENKLATQEYASRIFFNKSYNELNDTEKANLKETFVSMAEDNTIMYLYDKDTGYIIDNEAGNNSARTNLLVASRTAYASLITKENIAPLVIFIIVLLLTLVSMSIFRSPAVALMPDVTVKPLRSKANAIINLMGTAGGIIVLVLGMIFGTGAVKNQLMSYTTFVAAVCVVMAIGLIIFLLKVREKKWAEEMQKEQAILDADNSDKETMQETGKLEKKKLVSLILILASVALWYMGYNAVTSKYSLYATNVLGMDYNFTLILAQAAAVVAYIPVGIIASKIGRKKSILAGIVMLTTAFVAAIFADARTPDVIMYLVFALAGIGWATINVNSFPMVVELATGANVGKYTGYYYTASMTAQAITPWLSGLIMDTAGTMTPLFPYASICVVLAFVTMFFVKHGDSKPVAKKSALENFDIDD